jgi:hypothetical protein
MVRPKDPVASVDKAAATIVSCIFDPKWSKLSKAQALCEASLEILDNLAQRGERPICLGNLCSNWKA